MFFKKKKLTEVEFSLKFANELQQRVKGLQIVSSNEFELVTRLGDSGDFKHFLDNCYAEYIAEPKEIKELFERYLNSAVELYLPKEPINIERIFPVIKDHRYLAGLEDLDPDFETNHIFESYNSELYIFYAEDRENSINYLTHKDLIENNIIRESLKEQSIENLKNHISIERHGEDGYYMLTADNNYESSLILLNIWDKRNFPIEGNFVVGIPSRDVLLVTGSESLSNINRMSESVVEINQTGDHLVSDRLFELKNGKFEIL